MRIRMEHFVATAVSLAVAAGILGAAFGMPRPAAVAPMHKVPAPTRATAAMADEQARKTASVVFAGGCFWGVQGVFQHVRGVTRAESGYAGGRDAGAANYAAVSTGRTGHAEAVRVEYDPQQVSYAQLMQVFFSVVHDPTQRDRQGPDHGAQYRSAVFVSTPAQARATRAYLAELDRAGSFPAPIVTQVATDVAFHPAERYHQDYLVNNPRSPYIRAWDQPKIDALKARYPTLYREQPVLITKR